MKTEGKTYIQVRIGGQSAVKKMIKSEHDTDIEAGDRETSEPYEDETGEQ